MRRPIWQFHLSTLLAAMLLAGTWSWLNLGWERYYVLRQHLASTGRLTAIGLYTEQGMPWRMREAFVAYMVSPIDDFEDVARADFVRVSLADAEKGWAELPEPIVGESRWRWPAAAGNLGTGLVLALSLGLLLERRIRRFSAPR
ncbi:MAG: hypothetical protein M5U26_23955 [Planctomycetota bacterium]|nr:hypothetical protein [Planctomycetota bacterium]